MNGRTARVKNTCNNKKECKKRSTGLSEYCNVCQRHGGKVSKVFIVKQMVLGSNSS